MLREVHQAVVDDATEEIESALRSRGELQRRWTKLFDASFARVATSVSKSRTTEPPQPGNSDASQISKANVQPFVSRPNVKRKREKPPTATPANVLEPPAKLLKRTKTNSSGVEDKASVSAVASGASSDATPTPSLSHDAPNSTLPDSTATKRILQVTAAATRAREATLRGIGNEKKVRKMERNSAAGAPQPEQESLARYTLQECLFEEIVQDGIPKDKVVQGAKQLVIDEYNAWKSRKTTARSMSLLEFFETVILTETMRQDNSDMLETLRTAFASSVPCSDTATTESGETAAKKEAPVPVEQPLIQDAEDGPVQVEEHDGGEIQCDPIEFVSPPLPTGQAEEQPSRKRARSDDNAAGTDATPPPAALPEAAPAGAEDGGIPEAAESQQPAESKRTRRTPSSLPASSSRVDVEVGAAAEFLPSAAVANSEPLELSCASFLDTVPELNLEILLGRNSFRADAVHFEDSREAGLQNAGNTCYLNALLNAFARLPAMQHWCREHRRCHGNVAGCPVCVLASDLHRITDKRSVNFFVPQTVKNRRFWSNGVFNNTQQQDATEAFQFLTDACNTIDFNLAQNLADANDPEDPIRVAMTRFASRNTTVYTTPFHQSFSGVQRSIVRCTACGWQTTTHDPITALQLPLRREPCTLEALLDDYRATEYIRDLTDACRNVMRCGRHGSRARKLDFLRWPRSLVISLKRFEVKRSSNGISIGISIEKNTSVVTFPMTFKYTNSDVHSPAYTLRAIIVHSSGQATRNPYAGHYTAYVRSDNDRWYLCDDRIKPRLVAQELVLAAQAYMLFYDS